MTVAFGLATACEPAPASVKSSPSLTATPPSGVTLIAHPALTNIHMLDARSGWGETVGNVLRTADAGDHWWNVTPPPAEGGLASLFALSTEAAWAQFVYQPPQGAAPQPFPVQAVLYGTNDGGRTWRAGVRMPDAGQLDFVDAEHGWLFVRSGGGCMGGCDPVVLYRTTDGGAHWAVASRSDSPGGITRDCLKTGINFVDAKTGWVTADCDATPFYGARPPFLLRTQDGGVSWSAIDLPNPAGVASFCIRCVTEAPRVFSPQAGILLVHYQLGESVPAQPLRRSAFYRTGDGGRTWSSTPAPVTNFASIEFTDMDHAWGVTPAGDRLYQTSDGARHWATVPVDPAFGQGALLRLVNGRTAWVLLAPADGAVDRALARTTDGGATWRAASAVPAPSGTAPANCSLPLVLAGDETNVAMLDYPSGVVTAGPRREFVEDSARHLYRTIEKPYLYGPGPATAYVSGAYYDTAFHRWLPVGPDMVSRDGSQYFYVEPRSLAPKGDTFPYDDVIHIVTVTSGAERTIAIRQQTFRDPAYGPIYFAREGIYLSQMWWEGPGPQGLSLLNVATGKLQMIFGDEFVRAMGGGAAWLAHGNENDPHATVSSYDGSIAPNEVLRRDLNGGPTVSWFYRPGELVDILGLDQDHHPVVVLGKTNPEDSSESFTGVWLVTAPGMGLRIAPPANAMLADAHAIWLAYSPGISAYSRVAGLQRISALPALPAGPCS